MVKKSSKRGLNTGNTIRNKRCFPGVSAYDYITVHEESKVELGVYQNRYGLLSQVIPSPHNDGVEYSLNKKQRWELIPLLRDFVQSENGNTERKVNLYFHQQGRKGAAPRDGFSTASTVVEFQTNMGPLRSKTNRHRMHMKTADLPPSELDHLSKRERRKLGRKKIVDMREEEKKHVESQYEDVQSTLNCHVVQRAPENGLIFQSKSYAVGEQLRPLGQRHRAGKAVRMEDYCLDDFAENFDYDDEQALDAPRTTTASIADYLDYSPQTFMPKQKLTNCSLRRNVHLK